MRIRIFQTIEDDIFKLTFTQDLSELSTDDQKRLNRYGEPEINFGGEFEYALGSDTLDFTLPDTYAKIVSGLPKTIEFDSKAGEFSTNTVTKLDAYRDAIIALMESEMEDLRAIEDTWTSEKLYPI